MSKVLVLTSSILGEYSQSTKLIDYAVAQLSEQGAEITIRDLTSSELPTLDGELAAGLRGLDALSARQQDVITLSNRLVQELKAHDQIIITAPMYNFTIPTQLKQWIDLVARAGVTFKYTNEGPVGLLTDKKAIVITTRGGVHRNATSDHLVPYLKTVLGFIGIDELDIVYAEGLAMGEPTAKESIEKAQFELDSLLV
ncbi:FMN-dependent NADH-azoreductase [Shewanella surugensis]|uniref:FMN dependent NADH:quinone oxidoreductase n=1 Tax=Shewanella surugensis TaxID=212020 RepID=A0ABT0LC89_9GAMM|nr:FMN-dependent NADH-azoreductase [Shewanella surugensis]MCL1125169.1 FMN-dependent NADH-azoreductase [Shewanella surugensis]